MEINRKKKLQGNGLKAFLSSTQFLTNGLFLIGCAVLFLGAFILRPYYGQSFYQVGLYIVFALSFCFLIAGAVFIVTRRELPNINRHMPSYKGKLAVAIGIFSIVISTIFELGFLYLIVSTLLGFE